MKVTIVGGWSDAPQANDAWNLAVTDQRSFIHACRSIGRRLAEKRHTIVVGSDEHNSADYYVVEGFLSELDNQEAPGRLIRLIQGIHAEGDLYPL